VSLIDTSGEYISAAGKATPPLAATGAVVAGIPLQEWVLIATLIYTVLMTANLIYKFFKDRNSGG
jgi:hypothetical protein